MGSAPTTSDPLAPSSKVLKHYIQLNTSKKNLKKHRSDALELNTERGSLGKSTFLNKSKLMYLSIEHQLRKYKSVPIINDMNTKV